MNSGMIKEGKFKNIKKLRKNKKLTLTQLAKISGVSAAAISQYENGVRQPYATAIKKLALALETTADFLLSDVD